MSLTAQQICTQAATAAHMAGNTALAGQLLNAVLSELCQNYNFETARKTAFVTVAPNGGNNNAFNPPVSSLVTLNPGAGPYPLPTDYLRMAQNEAMYVISGVPYIMINCSLDEFDAFVQQAGINNFPEYFTSDRFQNPAALYVWPPAGGQYIVQIRYYCQMADISSPQTSSSVPWFPNDNYLTTRVAGEMMKTTDDTRWQVFLGDSPAGAQGILNRYLKQEMDDQGRAQTVSLDRRRFGTPFSRLPNTKLIGW